MPEVVQESILKLRDLGRMPDASDDSISSEEIDAYSFLIDKTQKPINKTEAEILIALFPESGLYGLEWGLLHLIESFYSISYSIQNSD